MCCVFSLDLAASHFFQCGAGDVTGTHHKIWSAHREGERGGGAAQVPHRDLARGREEGSCFRSEPTCEIHKSEVAICVRINLITFIHKIIDDEDNHLFVTCEVTQRCQFKASGRLRNPIMAADSFRLALTTLHSWLGVHAPPLLKCLPECQSVTLCACFKAIFCQHEGPIASKSQIAPHFDAGSK